MARVWLGGRSPRGQRKEETVLPVKMEHLLCALDGDHVHRLGDKKIGAEGSLADGRPEANMPLICLLSLTF